MIPPTREAIDCLAPQCIGVRRANLVYMWGWGVCFNCLLQFITHSNVCVCVPYINVQNSSPQHVAKKPEIN